MKVKILRKDVKGQHSARGIAHLCHGDNWLTGDGVSIGVGKDHLAVGLTGHLVPYGILHVKVLIPFPGVGSDDLSIQHQVGVHSVFPQHCL